MIVKFDGKDIKEMSDLPRVVADTPVGKDVAVIVIRKGKEETKTVKLGRLEDGEKQASLTPPKSDSEPTPVVKKTLGLRPFQSRSTTCARSTRCKDTVKGVVILGVDSDSPAADKRLTPGDVIVEIAQEAVANPDDFQAKIDKLKKEGRRTALLLVAGSDGQLRFVALSLQ